MFKYIDAMHTNVDWLISKSSRLSQKSGITNNRALKQNSNICFQYY